MKCNFYHAKAQGENIPEWRGGIVIVKERVITVVKSQLPQVDEIVIDDIVQEIICDGEAVLHKIIRQVIARQREQIFEKNSKDSPIDW